MKLTKELYENSVKLFEVSLKAATLDKTFCIKIEGFKTPGNYAAELSLCILENAAERKVEFCNNIFKAFLPIVYMRGNTCQLKEQQCTLLHCLLKNEILCSTWNELVSDFSKCKTGFDVLYSFLLKMWFQNVIEWRNHVLLKSNYKELDLKLTPEEEETVCYVSGFIPFSLQKMYSNHKNTDLS